MVRYIVRVISETIIDFPEFVGVNRLFPIVRIYPEKIVSDILATINHRVWLLHFDLVS